MCRSQGWARWPRCWACWCAAVPVAASAVRRSRLRRWWIDARVVTVLAPPQVAADGAAALWGNLAGLIRPRWRRATFGQPHLAFEYVTVPGGSTVRIWVPGTVPPAMVERAVAAAWPGATTTTHPAAPPPTRHRHRHRDRPPRARASPGQRNRRWGAQVAGGVLRLARGVDLPIDVDTAGDPIAALLAANDLPVPSAPPRPTPPGLAGRDGAGRTELGATR